MQFRVYCLWRDCYNRHVFMSYRALEEEEARKKAEEEARRRQA